MKSSRNDRALALAKRMPDTPGDVVARMQKHLREQELPERGMAAAMNDFYARLEAAGVLPALVTEDIQGIRRRRCGYDKRLLLTRYW